MGHPRPVSPKCIPMPNDKLMQELASRGLRVTSNTKPHVGAMTNVKLPSNWGLIWIPIGRYSRDIQTVFLLNDNMVSAAEINWNGFDPLRNYTIAVPIPKKLDATKVTFADGIYEVIDTVTSIEIQYQQMTILYENYMLSTFDNQEELDMHYARLQRFHKDYQKEIGGEGPVRLIARTASQFVSKPIRFEDGYDFVPVLDIPWL